MKLLGVKQIVITNVAGAINTQYEVWSPHLLHTLVTLYGPLNFIPSTR